MVWEDIKELKHLYVYPASNGGVFLMHFVVILLSYAAQLDGIPPFCYKKTNL